MTTVYFDLDGTLLEYTTSFATLFARTLPVAATESLFETYADAVLTGLERLDTNPYERAFETVRETHGDASWPSATRLATEYVEREAAATRMAPPVRRLVETVAGRHPTGILTNGDGRMQRRKIDEHGLAALVDAVVISNEVGARKPDPAVFETAKERLPATTYVYVGDSIEEDVVPAREAGFEPVYVGGTDRPEAGVAAADTATLGALLRPLLAADGGQ